MTEGHNLRDHFRGALIGTMVGDALGRPVEGWERSDIVAQFGELRDMLPGPFGPGSYTDDTEMMIGLAEALLNHEGRLDLRRVAFRFSQNFTPSRGYGGNTQRILQNMVEGASWEEAVKRHPLPGGSLANGAAMRVAPVALAFYPDSAATTRAAAEQARVTGHTHPEGLFGARLQALAVLRALECASWGAPFPTEEFLRENIGAGPEVFSSALQWIGDNLRAAPQKARANLGVSGAARESVPAALWSFLSCRQDPEAAIVRAVNLGGDADTIAAMAAAIAGACHGMSRLPQRWLDRLEKGGKGRDYVRGLADRLWEQRRDRVPCEPP